MSATTPEVREVAAYRGRSWPPEALATAAASIRAEIARGGYNQSTVAAWLGVTPNAVSRRIRGETPWTLPELVEVAWRLDITVSRLLGES